VVDHLAALDRRLHSFGVQEVASDQPEAGTAQMPEEMLLLPGAEVVQDYYLVGGLHESVHQMAAYEPSSPRDQDGPLRRHKDTLITPEDITSSAGLVTTGTLADEMIGFGAQILTKKDFIIQDLKLCV
jgi:hypothetical protein